MLNWKPIDNVKEGVRLGMIPDLEFMVYRDGEVFIQKNDGKPKTATICYTCSGSGERSNLYPTPPFDSSLCPACDGLGAIEKVIHHER